MINHSAPAPTPAPAPIPGTIYRARCSPTSPNSNTDPNPIPTSFFRNSRPSPGPSSSSRIKTSYALLVSPRSMPWWPSPLGSLPCAGSQAPSPHPSLISCRKDQNLHGSCYRLRAPFPVRASPTDASESFLPQSELQSPSFLEFITSERVKVVSMLGLALALCNADRVVMSVAIVPLSLAHSWSRSFSGIVQSSFLWGYLMSPIVGGALVDYYGGKLVMAWGVTLWSVATFLTPWAAETSLWALLAMRILLGAAEGVALPSMNNMISRWFPTTERSRAVGIGMAGFHLGSAIGLLISPIIMARAGIFGPFVIFGLFGFLWVLVWLSATSSSPDRHPQISNYELHYIINNRKAPLPHEKEFGKSRVIPPFEKLLSKMPTWALISANAMHSWGYFVMLSWMPIYFNTIYGVDLRQAAWFSALPWAMMAILGYAAGAISDMLVQSGVGVTFTRKIMQSIGFVGPGIALLGLDVAKNPSVASALLTAAVGLSSFSHSGFLVNLQEIAPSYAGVLHGMSNTAGTLAAIVGTIGAGFFVEKMGSFQGFLVLTSLLYMACALFWNLFSTGEQVNFNSEIST